MANGECLVGVRHEEQINGLKDTVTEIKDDYKTLCSKINAINANVNRLLGGVAIACILLAVNIVIAAF
jgi:hypothetical protein